MDEDSTILFCDLNDGEYFQIQQTDALENGEIIGDIIMTRKVAAELAIKIIEFLSKEV